MCYPQQLGRSWKVFVPETSRSLFAMSTGTLRNLISHRRNLACNLRRNPPEPHRPSAPEPSRTSSAICTGTRRNFLCHVYRNPPGPCLLSVPEPSGTSSAICTGTRRNLVCYLHRIHPEPSGSSSAICAGTVRNLISFLHWNPLEPHQLSAPEPSGTFRNPPEPSPEPGVAAAPDRTRAVLGAKDPIASFAVGEKYGPEWKLGGGFRYVIVKFYDGGFWHKVSIPTPKNLQIFVVISSIFARFEIWTKLKEIMKFQIFKK